jgi:hypothetical protein
MYTGADYDVYGAFPLLLLSPCCLPFVSPFDPLLLTWNAPSCDRICPPRSQIACKLTSPVLTLSPNPPPPNSRNPNHPRLTKTTSGIIRSLLSGTTTGWYLDRSMIVLYIDRINLSWLIIRDLYSWWLPYCTVQSSASAGVTSSFLVQSPSLAGFCELNQLVQFDCC